MSEHQESDRGHGRRIALFAALLTRLEPDRDGVFEIKDVPGGRLSNESSKPSGTASVSHGMNAKTTSKRRI
jgi:hypothetical protein